MCVLVYILKWEGLNLIQVLFITLPVNIQRGLHGCIDVRKLEMLKKNGTTACKNDDTQQSQCTDISELE